MTLACVENPCIGTVCASKFDLITLVGGEKRITVMLIRNSWDGWAGRSRTRKIERTQKKNQVRRIAMYMGAINRCGEKKKEKKVSRIGSYLLEK